MNYYNSNKNQVDNIFIEACKKGDIEKVKGLIDNEKKDFFFFKKLSAYITKRIKKSNKYVEGMQYACENNQLEVVKYLVQLYSSDQEILHGIDIDNFKACFGLACENGHIDIVKYLCSLPKCDEHIHDKALTYAIKNNRFEVLKLLLTTGKLKKLQTKTNINTALISACETGNVDMVQYLLLSDDLKEHADIHAENDRAFYSACYYRNMKLVQYLIYDVNIVETQKIKNYINKNRDILPSKEVEKMFEMRNLNNNLEKNLYINNKPFSKKKI